MSNKNRESAFRALELLEDYYSTLSDPEDSSLREAIDRLTLIFKTRLFQALLDIQEFCESTLSDNQRSMESKVAATHEMANRWDVNFPLSCNNNSGNNDEEAQRIILQHQQQPLRLSSNGINSSKLLQQRVDSLSGELCRPFTSPGQEIHMSEHDRTPFPFDYSDHWSIEEIVLHRHDQVGLGFSIAGGIDAPCIPNDNSIYITRITPGGIADCDGRLRIHDILLRVNSVSFQNISHALAVDTLKSTGDKIVLKIKRLNPKHISEINLLQGPRGLGFSIAGGINTELVPNDHGVFVTHISPDGPADLDGHLQIGDRLIMVHTPHGDYDLTFVEHRQARDYMRQACVDSDCVTIVVGHPTTTELSEPHNSSASYADNNEIDHFSAGSHQSLIGSDKFDSDDRNIRKVSLKKGISNGFGFNILGGDDGDGVYISFVLAGGPADINRKLRKGDQILFVNDIDVRNVSHEAAAGILKNCGQYANLVVRYNPNDFARCESKISDRREKIREAASMELKSWSPQSGSCGKPVGMPLSVPTEIVAASSVNAGTMRSTQKRQFFVRTHFDYDPLKDSDLPGHGLAFRKNDILHVTNAADDDWWQAKKIDPSTGIEEDMGIIPSKRRVEKKERSRARKVNFGIADIKSASSTAERRKKKRFPLFGKERRETQSEDETDIEPEADEPLTYETVVKKSINYARPVVILGLLKDRLNEDLIQDDPEHFGICVAHTTRPKRESEVEGKEYHFAQSKEQMEIDIQNRLFIEAGQYNGNLYGTSILAVKKLAEQYKHCVLDVSQYAIRRLQFADLYPIAILSKPKTIENALELNKRSSAEQAQKLLDKTNKLLRDLGKHFSGVAEGDTYAELLENVKSIIINNNSSFLWIPSGESI
ncbi:hypothetical protein GJ496_005684 [Pomphorhynchus laevis]|nr:hypothetical protein GJ496_005684 [Pomphorhynchus laevis]